MLIIVLAAVTLNEYLITLRNIQNYKQDFNIFTISLIIPNAHVT